MTGVARALFFFCCLALCACTKEDPRLVEDQLKFERAIDDGRAKGGVVQLDSFARPGDDFVCRAGEVERIRDRAKIDLGIVLDVVEPDDLVPADSNAFAFVLTKNLSARMFPIREYKLENFRNDCQALPGLAFTFRLNGDGGVEEMKFGKSQ